MKNRAIQNTNSTITEIQGQCVQCLVILLWGSEPIACPGSSPDDQTGLHLFELQVVSHWFLEMDKLLS